MPDKNAMQKSFDAETAIENGLASVESMVRFQVNLDPRRPVNIF